MPQAQSFFAESAHAISTSAALTVIPTTVTVKKRMSFVTDVLSLQPLLAVLHSVRH